MEFKHRLLPRKTLRQVTTEKFRYYELPDGKKYFSVTTKIYAGEEEITAEAYKRRGYQAANRGSDVHNVFEKYMLNEELPKMLPSIKHIFRTGKPYIDKNITCVYGIESMLYSHILETAGAVDGIVMWEGKLSILDFKTSRRPIDGDKLEKYKIQLTAYAIMVRELYGIWPKQIVVMAMVDHEDSTPMIYPITSELVNTTRAHMTRPELKSQLPNLNINEVSYSKQSSSQGGSS